MGKETATQVQETQRVPNRKKPKARHILIKLTKIKHKEQILSAAREKQQTHKGIPIRITADLSIETLQARREWQGILKSDERKKTYSPDYCTQQGSHSNMKEKSKSFKEKQKFREFSTSKPSLQQC